MSLGSSLASGVSALKANAARIATISDNIANVNTVGYKKTRTDFATLVTETSSLSDYSAGGVRGVTVTEVSGQGLLQPGGGATSLGVDGAGLFVVKKTTDPSNPNEGSIEFTRAGDFSPDERGYLKNTAGLYLMGWRIDPKTGKIPANHGDIGNLVPISVAGLTGTAQDTTEVSLRANLKSSETIHPNAATISTTPGYLTAHANDPAANPLAEEPQFESSFTVYDTQGTPHSLTISAVKTGVNTWSAEIYGSINEVDTGLASDPSTTAPAGAPKNCVAAGTLVFNDNGTLDLAASTIDDLANPNTPCEIPWTNGAAKSKIAFDFGSDGKANGFSQFDSSSTLISNDINGAVFGSQQGVRVSRDGTVTVLFDNGLSQQTFMLPLATFQNPNGLSRLQGNAYGVSDQSGNFALVEANKGGAGQFSAATLEASNVDLGQEFADMITTQRAYSAASKVITTIDEMLGELNNLKR